ncbi:MAG: dephospho-CoA kinase [Deltaproteobacteria bacterium]|nr:dephospho-CoA kinase [Deltaproteobacteria bacterium]
MGDLVVVGLTGGIGSGKSTVAAMLARRGCVVVDADGIVSDLLDRDGDVAGQVMRSFHLGRQDGGLDRRRLAQIVFESEWARNRIEMILHPKVAAVAAVRIEDARRAGLSVAVYDVPLLIETRTDRHVDVVVVVTAALSVRLERLTSRGMDEAEARRRMDAQLSDAERCAHADFIVVNDGGLGQLEQRVDGLWHQLTAWRGRSTPQRKDGRGERS